MQTREPGICGLSSSETGFPLLTCALRGLRDKSTESQQSVMWYWEFSVSPVFHFRFILRLSLLHLRKKLSLIHLRSKLVNINTTHHTDLIKLNLSQWSEKDDVTLISWLFSGDKPELIEEKNNRPAAHVTGNITIKKKPIPRFSILHRTERGNRISPLLQGGLKPQCSLKLCAGILMQRGRSSLEPWPTGLKMVPCKSMRRDSTTFIHGWSWSFSIVLLPHRSYIRCLWGEQDTTCLLPWWRPTERVYALSRETPGPQRVTSAPPWSCKNSTEYLLMHLTQNILVTHIMATSLVSTRSDGLMFYIS